MVQALLAATGASFEAMAPDIDEYAIGDRRGDPAALVRLVATAKADALVAALSGELDEARVLLTGDQVVTFDGGIREKPRDLAECREFVQSYSRASCGTVGASVHPQ